MSSFQKELADLDKQIDQITKRRAALAADLDKTVNGVQTQKKSLGSDLLAGISAVAGFDTLAREQLKASALEEAIAQADDQLGKLKQQQADKKRQIVMEDFNRIGDEAYAMFLESVSRLRETIAGLNALDAKLTALDSVGAPAGIKSENDDHLRMLRQACSYLRGEFSAIDGLPYKVLTVEQNFSAILSKAQERKSR